MLVLGGQGGRAWRPSWRPFRKSQPLTPPQRFASHQQEAGCYPSSRRRGTTPHPDGGEAGRLCTRDAISGLSYDSCMGGSHTCSPVDFVRHTRQMSRGALS